MRRLEIEFSPEVRKQAMVLSARLGFLMTLLWAAGSALASDTPTWLQQAASANVSVLSRDVAAVVLLKEQIVRVGDDGRVTTTERGAVRILTSEGRTQAVGSALYTTDTSRVRDIRAWMIRPSGEVRKYGKDHTVDRVAALNDVFNEHRVKLIAARDDAEPGAVFGYEWTTEDRSVFTQADWQFQERFPVLVSRYTLSLPSGWRAQGVMFNHRGVEPSVSQSSYTWEMRDLPAVYDEPKSPPITNLVPRLAVSYFPPEGSRASIGPTFTSWRDVSRWLSELSNPQMALNDEIAAKARELAAGATTEFERIQAIGRYAQSVNYISIQTGIGRGGGYRPHTAIEVFNKFYGDCKDKANLMRAMLKALDIQSYMVAIYSGDPSYVREEWPSPQQFNHAIIAVKVSDQTDAPAIVRHPKLGRLLVFDPTDDSTPLGDLPDHEQGSLALVVAGDDGALVRMPTAPPEANRLDRHADVVLGSDGSITASIRERAQGQSAISFRREFKGLSRPDYVKAIERWITGGATGARVSKVEPADDDASGRFNLDVEFSAARYGQLMQNRLLVFRPAIVSRHESLVLTDPVRKYPVVLDSYSYRETARIKLPTGFEVDEIPEAAKLDTRFGSYTTSYEVQDGHLHFSRSLTVMPVTVPVAQYETVRRFFEEVRAAEQSPVVLERK